MAGGPVVEDDEDKKDEKIRALDAGDIALLKSYVRMPRPYALPLLAIHSRGACHRVKGRTTSRFSRLRRT
jgi:hypothetical protein